MAEDVFPGIDFTLPTQGKLNAAREIGRHCGAAWYTHDPAALPPGFPNSISDWSVRCRAAWREGLVSGWHAAKASAPPPVAAPIDKRVLVGYARVSTQDQSTNLQLDALAKAGCSRVFSESASGAQRDRPELARALDYMRPGDTLVVWKLDRLARSLKQLIETVESLEGKGIGFRSLTESIDTTTAGGKLTFHIFAALAEFERSMIRERTRAGLDAARARGRVGGRPRSLTDKDLEMAKTLLANPDITVEEVASRLSVAPATLYRYLPGGRGAIPCAGGVA
ncbi:MAG: recombinase family protein [Sphingobacteriia bacterium]|nr:recombinase family protein [Sphingobacteriia bacterium]